MQAIALGSLEDMEALIEQGSDLTAVDRWGRSPWLLSLQVGDLAKAKRLLAAGANPYAVGRCSKLPIMYALEAGSLSMVTWLLELGLDVNATDQFGHTALITAAGMDQVEAANLLLAAGANPAMVSNSNGKAIKQAHSVAMIDLLIAAGEDLCEIDQFSRCLFTNVDVPGIWELDAEYYHADKHRRFGTDNPEEMTSPFWREMVKHRCSAYVPRSHYEDQDDWSAAVWCFQRFGQSITRLPDGRVIEIAGEHEDYYDPDFCIYNDVVVYDGQGDFKIYGYPRTVFPPTDFHTATLVDDWIYIIGNLGYMDERVVGKTPVYRLNCNTLEVEEVMTTGNAPGWISRHRAMLHDRQIHIWGGQVWTDTQDKPCLTDNKHKYILDLDQHCWY